MPGPMTFQLADLSQLVTEWMWPFARIAALVAAAPVIGTRSVPARVKLALAVALTAALAPLAPSMPAVDPLSVAGFLITAQQVLTGLAMGFAARLVMVVLEIAGQQIAQLMGLGFASLSDPQSGVQTPMISQFYVLLATLVFLGLDGHLLVFRILAQSFTTLPVGVDGVSGASLWILAGQAGWVFSAGLLLALPAIAAMLTVNLAFGVMARSAPQLNIFVIGFPISMLFGLFVMFFTLPTMLDQLEPLFTRALELAARMAQPGP